MKLLCFINAFYAVSEEFVRIVVGFLVSVGRIGIEGSAFFGRGGFRGSVFGRVFGRFGLICFGLLLFGVLCAII